MCKESSDAYYFIRDIVDFGGKQCTLFSHICTILFGYYPLVSFILVFVVLMPILKKIELMEMFDVLVERSTGAAGQCKWNEQRET
jgi:hypothetical protein